MGPMGPKGPQEGTGGQPQRHGDTPRGTGDTPRGMGDIFGKSHFFVSGRPPTNPPKPSQNSLPSLGDPSQSLRAAFLVQAGTKNPSRALTATHFGLGPARAWTGRGMDRGRAWAGRGHGRGESMNGERA